MHISSGARKKFPFVTTWFSKKNSQKLDANHVYIEPFEALSIFGRILYLIFVGSDFIMLKITFPAAVCNKYSRLSTYSLVVSNSGNSLAYLMPLPNCLQFLKYFLKSFSKEIFNLISTSSAGALSSCSLLDSWSDQLSSLRCLSIK